jgi:hypothetical protein
MRFEGGGMRDEERIRVPFFLVTSRRSFPIPRPALAKVPVLE